MTITDFKGKNKTTMGIRWNVFLNVNESYTQCMIEDDSFEIMQKVEIFKNCFEFKHNKMILKLSQVIQL